MKTDRNGAGVIRTQAFFIAHWDLARSVRPQQTPSGDIGHHGHVELGVILLHIAGVLGAEFFNHG